MSPELTGEVLEFNHASDRNLYRAALEAVAQARKMRAKLLELKPRAERQAVCISSQRRPGLAMSADTLLRNWLLKKHTMVLQDFLDALRIKHENGVVEDLPKAVEDDRLKAAVEVLLAKHPHEVVAVYLQAFNSMNAESWSNLEALLQAEPRLQL